MKEHYDESNNDDDLNIGNIKKFIKNCISGNISLKVAFWGVWFAGVLFFGTMLSIIIDFISTIIKSASELSNWFSENYSYFLLFYFSFAAIVVWRCKIYNKLYWLYIARIFTLWVVINSAYKIFKSI